MLDTKTLVAKDGEAEVVTMGSYLKLRILAIHADLAVVAS